MIQYTLCSMCESASLNVMGGKVLTQVDFPQFIVIYTKALA